jgi:hypothetical protein
VAKCNPLLPRLHSRPSCLSNRAHHTTVSRISRLPLPKIKGDVQQILLCNISLRIYRVPQLLSQTLRNGLQSTLFNRVNCSFVIREICCGFDRDKRGGKNSQEHNFLLYKIDIDIKLYQEGFFLMRCVCCHNNYKNLQRKKTCTAPLRNRG